ncbi:MAG: hypothetical protein AB7N54_00625 [Alphaproteobacteria bacterium]
MRLARAGALVTSVATLFAAAAAIAADPAMVATTDKGPALVDEKGMTLYTFDRDAAGVSNCNDQCAVNWPPLMASAEAKAMGKWSVIKRKDGAMQWAYDGKPLYTWIKDAKKGDTTGDGVNNVWRIAKP